MKSIFKSQFWAMLLVAAMAVGCTNDPIDEVGGVDAPSAEPIEVGLSLSVEPLSAGTLEAAENGTLTESRAIGENGFSETINNLWIIQFNGTDDESVVVGSPKYFSPYDPDISIVTLIPSTEDNTIVYLANTFKSSIGVIVGTTLAEFKSIMTTMSSEEGCFTTDGTDKYMLMNGYQEATIDGDTSLACTLKRNIAKVTVNIVDATDGALTLTGAQMCNVATKIPYFAEQVTRDSETGTLETPFPANSSIINYDLEPLTFTDNTATLTFYVPCNMRGVVANSTAEASKPVVAPNCATFLSVVGGTTTGNYAYNFYLGENMTNDFNIKPNYHYSYTFTFNGVGDPAVDNRIESLGEIDYRQRESSNCYILNPAASYERSYLIPIEDRITTFWNEYTSTPVGAITKDNWVVDVLWYDCNDDPIATDSSATLTRDQVRIETCSEALQPEAIKVTLGQGFSNVGNIVVAVKQEDTILWSWHFWITDYNPDSVDHVAVSDQYVYDVDSGEIHRYNGTLWETDGQYENSFIMDRNLGARDASYPSSYGAGVIHYQFGRKDPFPGNASSITVTTTETSSGESFATAVQNPTIYYYYTNSFYDWCSEVASYNTTCLWNDENASSTTDKSIFDPSPLGWKLPITGTWSDFSTTTFTYDVFDGLTYNGYAYYPASGIRGSASGTLSYAGTYGYSWSASPNGSTHGRSLYLSSLSVSAVYGSYRATGLPVRPVKDVQ
ncbi:MAG: DUF4906 domain-containing protein [Rikenellaceae bacterium]